MNEYLLVNALVRGLCIPLFLIYLFIQLLIRCFFFPVGLKTPTNKQYNMDENSQINSRSEVGGVRGRGWDVAQLQGPDGM